jgi:hypothetical protein
METTQTAAIAHNREAATEAFAADYAEFLAYLDTRPESPLGFADWLKS